MTLYRNIETKEQYIIVEFTGNASISLIDDAMVAFNKAN